MKKKPNKSLNHTGQLEVAECDQQTESSTEDNQMKLNLLTRIKNTMDNKNFTQIVTGNEKLSDAMRESFEECRNESLEDIIKGISSDKK